MNIIRRNTFVVMFLTLIFATSVIAKTSDINAVSRKETTMFIPVADQELAVNVSDTIRRYVFYDIYDWIQIQARDGVVTLSGEVHQPWHKNEILKRAEKVQGVQNVVDQINVLSLSRFDDQLRFNVARRIYNNPVLERYSLGPHPSIHIIVDHGVVTLQGFVNSQSEKQIAGVVARESKAFKVINNLQIES